MRFGLALPHFDYSLPGGGPVTWPAVRDWAQRAEEMGFDSLWISDHMFLDLSKYGGTGLPQGTLEPFVTLAALAMATRKARLGLLVACNDLRSPSLVAKMATTLHLISGGRFDLGMGAGWYPGDFSSNGVAFDPAGVRIDRLAEAVQIVVGLLAGGSFSISGRHYRLEEALNLPGPGSSRPAVWVGGKGDRMARLAGRHADGYNAVWAWTPEGFSGRLAQVRKAAERAGRDPGSVRASVGLYTLPGRDQVEVQARWERYRAATPGVGAGTDAQSWGRDKLAGSPSEIAGRIGAFEAAGAEEVILGFGLVPFQVADTSAVDMFVEEIFPLVRHR